MSEGPRLLDLEARAVMPLDAMGELAFIRKLVYGEFDFAEPGSLFPDVRPGVEIHFGPLWGDVLDVDGAEWVNPVWGEMTVRRCLPGDRVRVVRGAEPPRRRLTRDECPECGEPVVLYAGAGFERLICLRDGYSRTPGGIVLPRENPA